MPCTSVGKDATLHQDEARLEAETHAKQRDYFFIEVRSRTIADTHPPTPVKIERRMSRL